jgi:hypothetical protein
MDWTEQELEDLLMEYDYYIGDEDEYTKTTK